MPRLILHIGTHKTATTSIQRFFKHHQASLADRGVFYPDYSLIGRKPHYAHLGMVNALSGRHKNYSAELAESFFRKVLERVPDHETTILSAEPFYRHVLNDPEEEPLYTPEEYWPLRESYIARIRDLFGEAQVVVVFRRQADYAQSLYQEHVKVTRYRGNFREFLNDFWYHFVFAEQARAWNAAFPGLQAMLFDRLTATGDPTAEFCRLLGLPVEGLGPVPRANEGLPVDLVVLKRMLHRGRDDKDTLRDKLEALAERLPPEVVEGFRARSFFNGAGEMKTFQTGFAAQNETLRPFLLHDDLPAEGPVFPAEFRKGLNFGDRLKPPLLRALLDLSLQAPV
ncbi:hypothetical protein ACFSDD_23625 [Salipiger marinus]|uniref:hypothetical protein n=1 Tax=Salipiger marinus TaxID=555512 RepID=UPI002B5560CE|nr:hypothetical protein [Salipiger manganoxidans]MEB3421091.1 hypothetical protein [Salipiger manganoxidans]